MIARKKQMALLAASLAAFGIARQSHAASVFTWTGAASGDLSVVGNYVTGGVVATVLPTSVDEVDFEAGDTTHSPLVINSPNVFTARYFSIGNETGTLPDSGARTVSGTGTIQIGAGGTGNIDTNFGDADLTFTNTEIQLNGAAALFASSSSGNTHNLNINTTNSLKVGVGSGTGAVAFNAVGGNINITPAVDFTLSGIATRNLTLNAAAGKTITLTGGLTPTTLLKEVDVTGAVGGKVILGDSATYAGFITVGRADLQISNATSLGANGSAAAGYTEVLSSGTTPFGALLLNNVSSGEYIYLDVRDATGATIVPHIKNVSGANTLSGGIELERGGTAGHGTTGGYAIQSDGVASGDLLTVSGPIIYTNAENLTGGIVLALQGAGNGLVSGAIGGNDGSVKFVNALGLAKHDAGTWTLSGPNTYTGTTTIDGGKLLVNGTNTGGGNFTVAGGATLGGNGTINIGAGNVTVASGGKYAPGNSIDQQNIVGNLVDAGTFEVEYEGVTNTIDRADVAGNIDLTGGTINFVDLGAGNPLDNPSYIFATYTGTVTGALGLTNVPAGYSVDYHFGGNNIALVAPEPASLGLASIGLLGLARRRRR